LLLNMSVRVPRSCLRTNGTSRSPCGSRRTTCSRSANGSARGMETSAKTGETAEVAFGKLAEMAVRNALAKASACPRGASLQMLA